MIVVYNVDWQIQDRYRCTVGGAADGEATCRTLTVLSTAPEKRRPLETARAVTLPWCLSRVWVQIMLSMLHTYVTHTNIWSLNSGTSCTLAVCWWVGGEDWPGRSKFSRINYAIYVLYKLPKTLPTTVLLSVVLKIAIYNSFSAIYGFVWCFF